MDTEYNNTNILLDSPLKGQSITESNIESNIKVQDNTKFIEFLESNLNSIITCPISGATFFNPVTGSDGFTYEASVIEEYQSQSMNPKSPMTREPMTKKLYKNNLILELINYSDKYDLEVSKLKFINGDSFEENVEIIQSYIGNGNYEYIYK